MTGRNIETLVGPRPAGEPVRRAKVLIESAHRSGVAPNRVSITRSASVSITFWRERRYAIFECDQDGDTVLTLTDRSRDEEAEAEIVDPEQESLALVRARRFLAG